MAEPEVEAAWRAEFKRIGETQVRDALDSITDEPKRQAAFRWLGDEAEARRLREEQTHHYVRWTFFAAVAAVIVGLIGVGLALLHWGDSKAQRAKLLTRDEAWRIAVNIAKLPGAAAQGLTSCGRARCGGSHASFDNFPSIYRPRR
jgi:hypothetical protein